MPTLPKRPCGHPGCGVLVAAGEGRCPRHQEQHRQEHPAWSTTTTSASSRGYGARWRKLRLMILRRDPVCTLCHREASTEVDHIKPRAQGGDDADENLRGVCDDCHARKTARDSAASRRAARAGWPSRSRS